MAKIWLSDEDKPYNFDGTRLGVLKFLHTHVDEDIDPATLAYFPTTFGDPLKSNFRIVSDGELVAFVDKLEDLDPPKDDPVDADALKDMLRKHLSIELDTYSPAYSGSVYLNVILKFDGVEITKARTTLPGIDELKRSEYNDW